MKLKRLGITFGRSRLALAKYSARHQSACVNCGLCLYGCPYELIFNAASRIPELQKNPNFEYRNACYVESLAESGSIVKIRYNCLSGASAQTMNAARVFLGAGVVSSSRIILESLGAFDQDLTIKDSQYFIIPFLRFNGVSGIEKEDLQTLSQLCLLIDDPHLSSKSIQLLVYTYNQLFSDLTNTTLGGLLRCSPPLRDGLLSRLTALQGYLHSDDSSQVIMRLAEAGEHPSKISLEGQINPNSKSILNKLLYKLYRLAPSLKGTPIPYLSSLAAVGKSYHLGGSFPMQKISDQSSAKFCSDLLGRPAGFSRVHLVDASTFPTVPATNLTLSVMANAMRIAGSLE